MSSITIQLSEIQREFVDAEVAAQGFASAEAYVQALVDEASKSKAIAKFERMLDQGVNSGESKEWTREDAEELKREIRERARGRNGSAP